MDRALHLTVLLFLSVLAGCSSPAPVAPSVPGPTAEPAQPPPVLHGKEGTTPFVIRANPGLPALWGSHTIGFNTTGTVSAIVVEVAWEDPTGQMDLDAYLEADVDHCPYTEPDNTACRNIRETEPCRVDVGDFHDCEGGSSDPRGPSAPDSPSRVVAEGDALREVLDACADPCWWNAYAWAKDPAVDVSFQIRVSVFSGGPVPEGYTALPPA